MTLTAKKARLTGQLKAGKVKFSAVEIADSDPTEINNAIDDINGEVITGQALDKLAVTDASKADIKTAIEAYTVDVDDAPLSAYAGLIEDIGDSVEATFKAALDAANEEASADLTAGIALVDGNYADIKAAITAKGVDMTGVKPSGYDAAIANILSASGDAVAADLLAGKTASNASGAITGTRPTMPVFKTGETTSYSTGDDGNLQTGYTNIAPAIRFANNGDSTITDLQTGLMWSSDSAVLGTSKNWQDNIDAAIASEHAGYTDWRVPNMFEYISIMQLTDSANCLLWLNSYGFNISNTLLWTSDRAATTGLYVNSNPVTISLGSLTASRPSLIVRGPIAP